MNIRATTKSRRALAHPNPRGTAVAVAVSAAVVIVSTVLLPKIAVEGAAVDASYDDYDPLYEFDWSGIDTGEGDVLEVDPEPYLRQLDDLVGIDHKREPRAVPRLQRRGGSRRRRQRGGGAGGGVRWSAPRRRRPALRSKFYDYLLQYRGPFAFGGMKRSRAPGMTFVDATRRSGRAGRHRAKLYGNSAVRLRRKRRISDP